MRGAATRLLVLAATAFFVLEGIRQTRSQAAEPVKIDMFVGKADGYNNNRIASLACTPKGFRSYGASDVHNRWERR
jgi:hypothetical protein